MPAEHAIYCLDRTLLPAFRAIMRYRFILRYRVIAFTFDIDIATNFTLGCEIGYLTIHFTQFKKNQLIYI